MRTLNPSAGWRALISLQVLHTLVPVLTAAALNTACEGARTNLVPGTSDPGRPVQSTPIATRYPVVALADGRAAIVMSRGRVDEDANRPVQQFAQNFDLLAGPQGTAQALAGITGNGFVASDRPEAPERNNSLAMAGSGSMALALWLGSENGSVELNANLQITNGSFAARQRLASGLTAVTSSSKRIAVDASDNALAVWLGNDGLQKARVYSNGIGWEAEQTIPGSAMDIMGDTVMQAGRGWHTWIAPGGTVWAAQVSGITWRAPIVVGRASYLFGPPPPPRIAWHARALVADPVVVWKTDDGLRYNRLRIDNTVAFADGAPVPTDGAAPGVQVAMAANGDVMAVWRGAANLYAGGTWGAHAATGIRSPRVAADARGNFAVAGISQATGEVAVNRYAAGSGWLGVEALGSSSLSEVDVAMDDSGRAMVVWETANTDTAEPAGTRIAWRTIGVPNAVMAIAPNPAAVGAPISFDGSASADPLGAITRWRWDFGDGVQANTPTAGHAYATPGTYEASLTVTDASGLSARTAQLVTVTAAAPGGNLLINPDFDVPNNVGGLPTAPANWRGDAAQTVNAEQGIAPRSAPGMLRFTATGNISSTNTEASQQWQIVDLSRYAPDIAAGRARADGSVWFNRVIGTTATDRRFALRLLAFEGPMSELPARFASGNWLAVQTGTVDTIGLLWQQATASLVLPAATTYLMFEIHAFEDVSNDGKGAEEFQGHYADDALLVINPI